MLFVGIITNYWPHPWLNNLQKYCKYHTDTWLLDNIWQKQWTTALFCHLFYKKLGWPGFLRSVLVLTFQGKLSVSLLLLCEKINSNISWEVKHFLFLRWTMSSILTTLNSRNIPIAFQSQPWKWSLNVHLKTSATRVVKRIAVIWRFLTLPGTKMNENSIRYPSFRSASCCFTLNL